MRISDWSSDVCSSDLSAPAAFEVVRVDAAGKVAPLPEAQLRLYRENRRHYWRYDDQRGWNSGYTDTEELVESRVIALPDRSSEERSVGKEGVSTGGRRWSPSDNKNKKNMNKTQ